jgi:uncharacterized protein (DUF2336 family)
MSQQASVTGMDVRKLMQEPSGRTRGLLAGKIASDYRAGIFNPKEMALANDIFRILLKDIEKKVRQSIAEHICHSPNVPRDIIQQIVNDDVEVALYALEFSRVLTDEDLLAILHSSEEVARLRAIARRENLSPVVATSLAETMNVSVLTDLLANKTAIIPENAIMSAWQPITSHDSLALLLVERGGLSLSIVEKMISAVSGDLKHRLIKEYKVSSPIAAKATSDVREWETLGIIAANSNINPDDDEQVEDLVNQLSLNGRLTHSLLIRSLCMGSLNLFETGLARLAGVPRVNARMLLSDAGSLGFHAIYKSAHMPEGFENGIRVLLNISHEESEYGYKKPDDFKKRVVDRIYREGYHRSIDNMEYLLSIVGGKIARESVNG